ncbi:hypothetical protein [Paucibacter sp. KCTC 42545]|uniref:hypothetical protein n=1 Tax=Paucibacter sp. KCTC 42545 TaxID=1768242 RepID=UPI000733BB71|nr:hypothetical protein [Paucibacter sp. KCTC 42545]ALT79512.1 hypothetical protein AT984_00510 [Paucibacter sp. KCTC 42545]
MDSIPIVFFAFKALVLGIGMFVAIKWHYDQERRYKNTELRAVLLTSAKVTLFFLLSALGLVIATFALAEKFGLDLTLP